MTPGQRGDQVHPKRERPPLQLAGWPIELHWYCWGDQCHLDDFIGSVIIPARDAFNATIESNKTAARIKKATASIILGQDAAEIAARAAPNGGETKQSVEDLVRLQTNKATADLQRKIASLQGQLDARKGGGAGKKKGGKKKDFRGRGKTAGRNDAGSKARAGAAGPGNAAGAAAKKNKKKSSNGKSGGKKGGNGTAKRS